MRKKDWAILLLTAAYSFLFYHQHSGLNFLLFTLAVIIGSAAADTSLLKNRNWLFSAALTLVSGVFVFMYSSALAVFANVISLLLIASFNSAGQSSVLFSLAHSVFAISGSLIFVIRAGAQRSRGNDRNGKAVFSKILTVLIPLVLAVIFLAIYKSANPLFANFTEKIDLSFISIEWLVFTLGGFLIVYGAVYHHKIKRLQTLEENLPLFILKKVFVPAKWDERKAVILLFVLLNVMLFFINVLDVNYLYLGAGMPVGITHKEFVHNGVGMLILSILLAIGTILYFFRGSLNFDAANKPARLLVFIWIVQNLMMVASTAVRNQMYINDALLTYKRIGVYFWLIMAATGLIITFIKLLKLRSTWYLFKTNAAVAYVILILSAGIDWDKVITNYNMFRVAHVASLDKKYLISLSETNLADLYAIKNNPEFNTDSLYHYEYAQHYLNSGKLDAKLYSYFKHIQTEDWRSFSLRKNRVTTDIEQMNAQELISGLDLSQAYVQTLKPVFCINNIKELNLEHCKINRLAELENFKKLQRLNLNGNNLTSLDSLPELNALKELNLGNNSVSVFKYLSRTPNLELLDLSNNNVVWLDDLPAFPHLKKLLLNGNRTANLSGLERYPLLEELSLVNYKTYLNSLPNLQSLKHLDLSNSPELQRLLKLKPPAGLTWLDLSGNGLKNTDLLLTDKETNAQANATFKKLEELQLNNNELFALNALEFYPGLKVLNVADNHIATNGGLVFLIHLEKLQIANNQLQSIAFVNNMPLLNELNLSNNQLINEFTPLKNAANLTWLDVSGTNFNDLSLIQAPKLEYLNLKKCKLTAFKAIERFKNLKTLVISNLEPDAIQALKKLKNLKTVSVSYTDYKLFEQLQNELRSTEVIMDYTE